MNISYHHDISIMLHLRYTSVDEQQQSHRLKIKLHNHVTSSNTANRLDLMDLQKFTPTLRIQKTLHPFYKNSVKIAKKTIWQNLWKTRSTKFYLHLQP
ncbi:MAG: hypothetical protein RLZZ262_256 [Bacteroidota bacterium]|jgi:ribosomal protein L33